MLVSTTTTIEGRPVGQYLGVVAGETILGANIFRDIGAQFRNITGGRAAGYEKELRKARETAIEEMVAQATEMGGDRTSLSPAFATTTTDCTRLLTTNWVDARPSPFVDETIAGLTVAPALSPSILKLTSAPACATPR